jgi:aryl-alcohol dehydrogenase-like predicted oxidoreductase
MKPRILIGMWPLSGDFGPVSLKIVEEVIQKAVDNGLFGFDVAPSYGSGFAEMALGHVLGNDRSIKIYTKFGNHPFKGKDFSDIGLERSLEQSLVRLRRDSVEGIFLHNPRKEFSDYLNIPKLFSKLKADGYVSKLGLSGAKGYDYSNYPWDSIDIYQQDFNLLYQNELFPKRESSFFARSCLATGILSGKLNNDSKFHANDHRSAWLKGERLHSLVRRTDIIRDIAGSSYSLPSLARRYVLFNADVGSTILGVSKPEHIEDILQDLDSGPLPKDIVASLKKEHDIDFGLKGERHLGF